MLCGCCDWEEEEEMSKPTGVPTYAIECLVNAGGLVTQHTLFGWNGSGWDSLGTIFSPGGVTSINITNPVGHWKCIENMTKMWWKEAALAGLPLYTSDWIVFNDWLNYTVNSITLNFINILPLMSHPTTFVVVWYCGTHSGQGLSPKVIGVTPVG